MCRFRCYADQFATLELNSTCYRLSPVAVWDTWREREADGFINAVKVSRYLTHIWRLQDPEAPWERLWERTRHRGLHLGPMLFQTSRHHSPKR